MIDVRKERSVVRSTVRHGTFRLAAWLLSSETNISLSQGTKPTSTNQEATDDHANGWRAERSDQVSSPRILRTHLPTTWAATRPRSLCSHVSIQQWKREHTTTTCLDQWTLKNLLRHTTSPRRHIAAASATGITIRAAHANRSGVDHLPDSDANERAFNQPAVHAAGIAPCLTKSDSRDIWTRTLLSRHPNLPSPERQHAGATLLNDPSDAMDDVSGVISGYRATDVVSLLAAVSNQGHTTWIQGIPLTLSSSKPTSGAVATISRFILKA